MDLSEKTENENRHPWELSRAHCIFGIISREKITTLADIGAGDGFFARKMRSICKGKIYAIDSNYAEDEKIEGVHCLKSIADLPKITDAGAGIIMMDVLEHLENDKLFMEEVLEKLGTDGKIFITVPAFQFLFSAHDTFLKHYRRYNRKQLLNVLKSCNLKIERCHYFYSSLFFVRLLSKLKPENKTQKGIGQWKFKENNIITKFIYWVLNFDFNMCAIFAKMHIYLPGLSLVAECSNG